MVTRNDDIWHSALSVRAINGLTRGGYETFGDIADSSYSSLMHIRNLGELTVKEIAMFLEANGMVLPGYHEAQHEKERKESRRLEPIRQYQDLKMSDLGIDMLKMWDVIKHAIYVKFHVQTQKELKDSEMPDVILFGNKFIDHMCELYK